MAYLTIGDKQYEAKVSFKFERVANKKYKGEEQYITGLEKIYQDLLSYKTSALLAFWDCATAHYKQDQPAVEAIELALEKTIEEEGGTERLFKEAFQALDNSGFFRQQLNEFWKNLDLAEELAEDEKEAEQAKKAKVMYIERRKELNP